MTSTIRMIADTPTKPQQATRLDDLAQMLAAYNQVTERMQHSHQVLEAEVLRLREELASTNAQLHRSKRLSALGEMAAGIAHEIRNPLAAIQLYAGMAVEDLDDVRHGTATDATAAPLDSAADAVRKIAAAVHGLSAIVNDVLTFAGQSRPEPRDLSVVDAVGRALDAHLPAIEAAAVTVIRHDLQGPALTIHADPLLLHQALLNLIRNAVDAMAAQPGDRTLTVAAAVEDGDVCLTLCDTGPGIAEQDVDRIFNPFFTTRNTGTGLGLAIVHRIVDAHGGAIRVRNDGGAVFELVLPAHPRLAPHPARSQAADRPSPLHAGAAA